MSMNGRQEQILKILNERGYITVSELAELTFTSPSSIRRDLTYLQNNGLVQRSHGGVSVPHPMKGVASFYDRAHRSVKEKRVIARKAASLLKDGQNIILDSSSTVTFLLPYLAQKKGITVFTNNLSTAMSAIEMGIETHLFGGRAINGSAVLAGADTYRAISRIRADLLFFSSQSLSEKGEISDSTEEENYARMLMLEAADTSVFLCTAEKFNASSLYRLCSLDRVDVVVFDRIPEALSAGCRLL